MDPFSLYLRLLPAYSYIKVIVNYVLKEIHYYN
jgi:hypothetical protein